RPQDFSPGSVITAPGTGRLPAFCAGRFDIVRTIRAVSAFAPQFFWPFCRIGRRQAPPITGITMNVPIKSSRKPAIVIGEVEHERLSGLASDAVDRIPEVAEELLAELDRARIVKAGKVPADTVQ